GTMTMPRAYAETIEVAGRFYPIKLRQAFGIDECGQGTKTRRWSEHTDGDGYIMLRTGYGHLHGDVATLHALLITAGLGYEWNLGEGRHSSFFAQAAWPLDLARAAGARRLSSAPPCVPLPRPFPPLPETLPPPRRRAPRAWPRR